MEIKHNPALTRRSQALRKSATKQENHLWYDFLRTYPLRFRRQVTIGRFIVDFYCAKARLVIELDGSQHYDGTGVDKDGERTAFLERRGLTVIRIPNNEVDRNFSGVCEHIDALAKRSPVSFADSPLAKNPSGWYADR